MATSELRNYDHEALFHAQQAENLLRSAESLPPIAQQAPATAALVHATLAVAYSQIGDQS